MREICCKPTHLENLVAICLTFVCNFQLYKTMYCFIPNQHHQKYYDFLASM